MASDRTPWMGVHALTEFIFCPRAGLLAYESWSHNEDTQHERANVRYLPDWNLAAIERGLCVALIRLACLVSVMTGIAFVAAAAQGQAPIGAPLLLTIGIAALGTVAWRQLRASWTLISRLRAASRTAPMLPDEESTNCESVNWWSLLAAGFESVQYKDALRDEGLRLAGRPWRVLRKGSLRIPAFRHTGEPRLRRQHFARMAAYCHLLETCEGCRSPYGVVIFAGTYDGLTVRNSPATRKALHDGLLLARSVVQQAKRPPALPNSKTCCSACPHGYPRAQARRWLRKVTGFVRRGVDGRFYSSHCGDRFQWVPPHDKAIRKRLV